MRNAWAMALIAVALLLAGCGTQVASPGNTTAPAGDPAAPAQPKVQRVVLAVPPPGVESNEMRHIGQSDTWQLRPVYEKLIGYDAETGKSTPQLATDWKLLPDGLSFQFQLRKGVQFHNGFGEATAHDVNFSYQELAKEDSQGSPAPNWRQMVKVMEEVGPYDLVVRLREIGRAHV